MIPGDPAVQTRRFHCKGHRFNPWSGNEDRMCHVARPKNKKKKRKKERRGGKREKEQQSTTYGSKTSRVMYSFGIRGS